MEKIEVCFQVMEGEISDILTAELSNLGYDAFWVDDDGLRGYIEENLYNAEDLDQIKDKYKGLTSLSYTFTRVTPDLWDKSQTDTFTENYRIGDFVEIASNEEAFTDACRYHLVMNANLAFGSGDHPSTHNCLESMSRVSFKDKTVFDIGSGTAILGIFAEKLGAKEVIAIDNNPWAFKVANEAVHLNKCENVKVIEGDLSDLKGKSADIVLANLNMDVFREYFTDVASLMHTNSHLLLSGFMKKDELEMVQNIVDHGLTIFYRANYNDWITIIARHKKSH